MMADRTSPPFTCLSTGIKTFCHSGMSRLTRLFAPSLPFRHSLCATFLIFFFFVCVGLRTATIVPSLKCLIFFFLSFIAVQMKQLCSWRNRICFCFVCFWDGEWNGKENERGTTRKALTGLAHPKSLKEMSHHSWHICPVRPNGWYAETLCMLSRV